jgi:hypothetical protein
MPNLLFAIFLFNFCLWLLKRAFPAYDILFRFKVVGIIGVSSLSVVGMLSSLIRSILLFMTPAPKSGFVRNALFLMWGSVPIEYVINSVFDGSVFFWRHRIFQSFDMQITEERCIIPYSQMKIL